VRSGGFGFSFAPVIASFLASNTSFVSGRDPVLGLGPDAPFADPACLAFINCHYWSADEIKK
jgi:hypothetical protein